jgi:hypothetical protein
MVQHTHPITRHVGLPGHHRARSRLRRIRVGPEIGVAECLRRLEQQEAWPPPMSGNHSARREGSQDRATLGETATRGVVMAMREDVLWLRWLVGVDREGKRLGYQWDTARSATSAGRVCSAYRVRGAPGRWPCRCDHRVQRLPRSFPLAHRASAALRARLTRSCFVMRAAAALPPLLPPSLPQAEASAEISLTVSLRSGFWGLAMRRR